MASCASASPITTMTATTTACWRHSTGCSARGNPHAPAVAGDRAHWFLQQEDLRPRHHIGDVKVEADGLAGLDLSIGKVDRIEWLINDPGVMESARHHRGQVGVTLREGKTVAVRAGLGRSGAKFHAVLAPTTARMIDRDLGDGESDYVLAADAIAEADIHAANDQNRRVARNIFHHDEGIFQGAGPRHLEDGEIAVLIAEGNAFDRDGRPERRSCCQRGGQKPYESHAFHAMIVLN